MSLGPALVCGLLVVTTAVAGRVALGGAWPAPARRRRDAVHDGAAPAPAWLGAALASAALDWPAPVAARAWVALVVTAATAGLVLGGIGLGLVTTTLATVAPAGALRAMAGRDGARLEAGLPDALEATARSLRSGASLRGALAEASAAAGPELGRDLATVVHGAERGLGLGLALDRWAHARPLPGVRLATAAIALGHETGSPARALDGVAATLRDRQALDREVRALSSQARISGVVIAAAPLGFAVLAVGLDGATAAFLLGTPAGLGCLVAGLALDGAAAWWMARITRSAR